MAEFSGTGPLSKFQPDGVINAFHCWAAVVVNHLHIMPTCCCCVCAGHRLRGLQVVYGHLPGAGNAGGIVQEAVFVVRQTGARQERLQRRRQSHQGKKEVQQRICSACVKGVVITFYKTADQEEKKRATNNNNNQQRQ